MSMWPVVALFAVFVIGMAASGITSEKNRHEAHTKCVEAVKDRPAEEIRSICGERK